MELVKPNTNSLRLYRIKLFEPTILSAGKPKGGKDKPYIAGHVTDSSSTFTFIVNNSDSITVNVDSNGWWKWNVDRTITSLTSAFANAANLDECYLYKVKTNGACTSMFNSSGLTKLTLDNSLSDSSNMRAFFGSKQTLTEVICKNVIFDKVTTCWRTFIRSSSIIGLENATFENCTDGYQMFYEYGGKTLDLSNADFKELTSSNSMFVNLYVKSKLENLNIKGIYINTSFSSHPKLTEQSVVNLFNAVSADGLTLTFHATVGAKIDAALEAGGEGTPEQNAIYNAYWDAYDRGYEINYTY